MTKFSALSFLFAAITGLFSLSMSSATQTVSLDRSVTLDITFEKENPLTFSGFDTPEKNINTTTTYETVGYFMNTLEESGDVTIVITPSLIDPRSVDGYTAFARIGLIEHEFDLDSLDPITFNFEVQGGEQVDVEAWFLDNKSTYLVMSFDFTLVTKDGTSTYHISDSDEEPLRVTIK